MFDTEPTPIPFRVVDVPLADPHPPVLGLPVSYLADPSLVVDQLWAEGLLHLKETCLRLEYQLRGNVDTYAFHTEATAVEIPLLEISALELDAGWRRTHLVLQSRGLTSLTGIPGAQQAEVVLVLPRDAREHAAALVAEAKFRAAELLGPSDQ